MSIWDDVRVGDTVTARLGDGTMRFPVVEIRRLSREHLVSGSHRPGLLDTAVFVGREDDVEVLGAHLSAIRSAGWSLSITNPNPDIPMGAR